MDTLTPDLQDMTTRCCIAGGGPAGMMAGLLLARAGIDVVVLEKHADFLRDFRGDTVHPSTLDVLHDLGLLEAFLARPHDKARVLHVTVGGEEATIADFGRLSTRCGFIAMMPQWEFLDFLRDEAVRYPTFRLLLNAEVTGLLEEPPVAGNPGRVTGVQVQVSTGEGEEPAGNMRVSADLVIGADGRRSRVREAAGMVPEVQGAPMDVLWMRLPVVPGDPAESGGRIDTGHFMAMIHRGTYWQCAYLIAKGGMEAIHARGLEAFRVEIVRAAPFFSDRVQTLQSWDDIKLLSVAVDRLVQWWRPGLLCIGDAAHAMSPIGGVGINLAVQDAVATANILAEALADAAVTPAALSTLLAQVQRRRNLPARLTQAAQVMIQNRLLVPVLSGQARMRMPWVLKLLQRFPSLQKWPAYAVGVGVRPEHVKSPVQTCSV